MEVKAMTPQRTIITTYIYPPIPTRSFDWSATFDGYEPGELVGYGPTEESAIKDLKDQIESEKEL
jgi:hypothetical protein